VPSETLLRVDEKTLLHRYLNEAREALLWKLEGLSEYDVRRPLTPTGTNLLGLWSTADALPASDMYAGPEETRESVVGFYGRVRVYADETIAALAVDAPGLVPWWSESRRAVTLREVLLDVIVELHRHAGHADVVRELVDGAVGMQDGNTNMPAVDGVWWSAHHARLEKIAAAAGPALRG
jgi:hypothetical protein